MSDRAGNAVAYALFNLEPRGQLFVVPGDPVYEGMVVGEHSRDNDIDVKRVGIVLSSEAEFFQHIVDQVVTPWLEHVGAFLKQGVAQGVFREDVDEKLLLSTIIGSLVAYEAIEGKAMDDDTAWASRMADLLWPALLK